MAQSRVPLVIALILAAALGVALFLKHSSLEAARSEQAQLQTRLQAVAAELASCESERVGASRQIDSLKRDQEELVRLRGEVSRLRRTSAPSAAAPPVPAPKPAATSVVPDVEPKTLTASVKARIPANGVLVTGGWESSPGRRAIVLVSPIATTQPDGTVTVEITTRIVEGPEASLAAIGIDLRSGDTSTAQQLFDASQHATLLGALEATEGLDLLSVPTITTADGRQAQVAWNADEHRRATEIGLIPKFDPTDGSIEVNVSASLAPWPAPAPVTPP
jgi:hypothetical protein